MPTDGIDRFQRLRAHKGVVGSLDWSSDGALLASASVESGLIIFDPERPDKPVFSEEGYNLISLAWRPDSRVLAASQGEIVLVDTSSGQVNGTGIANNWQGEASWSPDGAGLAVVSDANATIYAVGPDLSVSNGGPSVGARKDTPLQWSPDARYLAGYHDGFTIWDASTLEPVAYLTPPGHLPGWIRWSPDGHCVAHAADQRVSIVEAGSWEPVVTLEGHEQWVPRVVWSSCGRLLASVGWDSTIRLWSTETWQPLALLPIGAADTNWYGIAFHPTEPILAALSDPASTIDLWRIDVDRLITTAHTNFPKYTTAKVVLVGDSGVGKTGLGYRVATGAFREHSSTHGQHFWVIDELATVRADDTECEVVLWDLAGQSDYRLIHVLFLDDADAAILVFDPTRGQRALDAVDFWLKALNVGRAIPCPVILVAARIDRGTGSLDQTELEAFAATRGISGGVVATSASEGEGVDDLVHRLRNQIPWESMSATVTTTTFKAVKDLILAMKDAGGSVQQIIMTAEELRERLASDLTPASIGDSELWAAVRNLEIHGYLRVLRAVSGERVMLLAPELLNNLAASLILEARRNPLGLGAIDEGQALAEGYNLPEVKELPAPYGQVLTEAAIVLLLEHNVCFRETLSGRNLLIFPELINEKAPILAPSEGYVESVTYVAEGNVQNVYSSLVVLLGYTNVLLRVNQWQNRAEYEIDGVRVGLQQSRVRDDRLELTVYHHTTVDASKLRLFQGLVERFLQRRRVTVRLYPRIACVCGFTLPTEQIIAFIDEGSGVTFCPKSGDRIAVPTEAESVSLTETELAAVTDESEVAAHRTGLSVAIAQLRAYSEDRDPRVSCFISYAWGDGDHEQWVERSLKPDLEDVGFDVVFDRRSSLPGSDIARFVSQVTDCDFVLVVGTPDYLEGYENPDSDVGRIVAAEADLYNQRLMGTEQEKRTVIPLLRKGDRVSAFPPLLRGKAYADLTSDAAYFRAFFDLALQMCGIDLDDPAMADIRKGLVGPRARSRA